MTIAAILALAVVALAGIDLALAMIERDLGVAMARAVARQLVVYHRCAGGQSQFSALLELEPKSDRIQSVLAYAKRNLDAPLTVGQLAEAARLSPRQFGRAFRAEPGQSPAKAFEKSAHRGRPADDGAEPPSDRRHRLANGFRRSRRDAPRLPARLWTAPAGDPAKRAGGATA